MLLHKQAALGPMVAAVMSTALLPGCESGRSKEPSTAASIQADTPTQSSGKAPPLPNADLSPSPGHLSKLGSLSS
jgi:hypothetical protein